MELVQLVDERKASKLWRHWCSLFPVRAPTHVMSACLRHESFPQIHWNLESTRHTLATQSTTTYNLRVATFSIPFSFAGALIPSAIALPRLPGNIRHPVAIHARMS